MNSIKLVLDPDGTGRVFDELLNRCRAQGAQDTGDLHIVTKDNGTREGNPIAILAFTAVVNGKPTLVQTVTTVKLLKFTLGALNGKYPEL